MKQHHELELMENNEKKRKDASAEKHNYPLEKILFIPGRQQEYFNCCSTMKVNA